MHKSVPNLKIYGSTSNLKFPVFKFERALLLEGSIHKCGAIRSDIA